MKLLNLFCAASIVTLLAAGCSNEKTSAPVPAAPAANATTPTPAGQAEVAVIETSEGQLVVEFWPDTAPETVANFKKLARSGFYDGTSFHRIIDGFMIQGGDPLTKDASQEAVWGTGNPGYQIKGEVSNQSDRHHVRGVISMANSGSPDTAGSQFYICLADLPQLDGGYTTFGKLIRGDDALTKLGKSPVKINPYDPRQEMSRPINRVGLTSIKIVPADSVK